ncbi:MAG: hypothetical protein ACOY94_14660 [Bacillota bacterium]
MNILVYLALIVVAAGIVSIFLSRINELKMELLRQRRLLERLAAQAGLEPDSLDQELTDLLAREHDQKARQRAQEVLGLSASDAHDYVQGLRATLRERSGPDGR